MACDRIVIDTNVLISGLLSTTSTPARALERAVTIGRLVATKETLRELIEKLSSSKFDRYVTRAQRDELLNLLAPVMDIIEVLQPIHAARDPKDDKFLEAAVNGRASVIVTGDRDLLELHPFRGVEIVTAAQYLKRPPAESDQRKDDQD
jgi:putative PIN family toxin of toxin-antitoxin system